MSKYNLKSFRVSLVVLVASLFLTACDGLLDINFPDRLGYNSFGGYYGKIIDNDTQEPISDAKIMWNNQFYESNGDGLYEISNTSENIEVTIKVIKEGYKEYTQKVHITGEEARELNITLIPIE